MAMKRIKDYAADFFYMRRVLFDNLYEWTIQAIKLLLIMHIFACGWLFIHDYKKENGDVHTTFYEEETFSRYAESIYFVTTTISLVGYGDYKGFLDDTGEWLWEMSLLLLLILYGNYSFSKITQKVREFKKMMTPQVLAKNAQEATEMFLLQLQMKVKDRSLPENYIEFAKQHVYESVKSSTRVYF